MCLCPYCRLSYPACKLYRFSAVLFCHLWSNCLYHIIPHYHIKTARFYEKDFEYVRGVLIFSTTLSETLPILRINQRDIKIYQYHIKYLLLSSDLNETWFFWQTFEKSGSIKFHVYPSVGARLFHADRQVDRLTWRSWQSLFAILWTRLKWVKLPKNVFSYKRLVVFDVKPCSNEEIYLTFASFLCNHDIFIHFYAEDIGSTSLLSTWPMAPLLRRQ